MKIYQELNFTSQPAQPRVLALGFFDGVHRGHQQLLLHMTLLAEEFAWTPAVLTFADAPAAVFRKPSFAGLIQTQVARYRSLAGRGAQEIFALPLIPDLVQMEPQAFLEKYVVQQLQAQALVVGKDYSFGRGAQGRVPDLADFCEKRGIRLTIVDDYLWRGQVVSSSLIRQLLQAGQVQEANSLLDQPFCHLAQVVEGRKLGRRLGFPTLNVVPPASQLSLAKGVYLSQVHWQGQSHPAVTSVGNKPTVEEAAPLLSESFLLGNEYPHYGEDIRVDYLDFMRPEQKFDNLAALQAQVEADIAQARQAHARLRARMVN